MKTRILTLICIPLFVGFGYAQKEKTAYKYDFTVKGLKDTTVQLGYYFADNTYLKDSARVDKNGNFSFKGANKLVGGIYLVIFPNKTYLEFIVEEPFFSIQTTLANPTKDIKITGSRENEVFYRHLKETMMYQREAGDLTNRLKTMTEDTVNKETNKDSVAVVRRRLTEIDSTVIAFRRKLIRENEGTLISKIFRLMEEPETPKELPKKADGSNDSSYIYRYYKDHYFDLVDFQDDRLLRNPIFHKKFERYIKHMIIQIPDSVIVEADKIISRSKVGTEMFRYLVVTITNEFNKSNIMGMDAVYVHMVDSYYRSRKADWVDTATLYRMTDRASTLKKILINAPAPPFKILLTDWKPFELYSAKNDYVVVFIWDPDCGHCKKETPKLHAAYERMKKEGIDVEVVAIGMTGEEQKWRDFIKEHNLNWINGWDPAHQSNYRKDYDAMSTPQLFILDKDKKIIAKKIEADRVEDVIKFFERQKEMEKNGQGEG